MTLNMKVEGQSRRAKVRHRRLGPLGVSRDRAAAIARARLARTMIECEVLANIPIWLRSGCDSRPLPKHCWYVSCRSRHRPMTTGGTAVVVCISKRSGRVSRIVEVRGE